MLTLEMNYAEIVRELQMIEELSRKQDLMSEYELLLSELLQGSDDVIDELRNLRHQLEMETR